MELKRNLNLKNISKFSYKNPEYMNKKVKNIGDIRGKIYQIIQNQSKNK